MPRPNILYVIAHDIGRHMVRDGMPGHIRGVDVFRVRGGKVAEKLSYVKG